MITLSRRARSCLQKARETMRFRLVFVVLLVVLACQQDRSTTVTPKLKSEKVRFEVEPPEIQLELPAYELAKGRPRPDQKFIARLPKAQQTSLREDVERDFEFHPSFAEIADQPINMAEARALMDKAVLQMREAFIETSDQDFVPDDARVLHVARAHRGATAQEDKYFDEKPVLLYVSLRRRVNKLRVDGPGSRFSVAISASGEIKGAVFYWTERKQQLDKPLPTIVRETVKDAIKAQLKATEPLGEVVVKKIELAYYDSGQRFLQPVYRYIADLAPSSPVSKGRTSLLVGYVPLSADKGMTSEVPTSLRPETSSSDSTLAPVHFSEAPPRFTMAPPEPIAGRISVGRYITHDEHTGWANDSQAFWQELSRARPPLAFEPAQNYFSWRFMLTSRKDYFVNSVDLALIEAHGSPMTVMSYRDFGGDTRFNADVPLPGYGSDGGGRLKHLIVHSCRAIPAPIDTYYASDFRKSWANNWWDLFNGLSSVVGYRSSMFIDDGAGAAMGRNLARGEAVVPAWIGSVASLNIYDQDSWVMTHCASPDLLGRASAIAVCDEGIKATVAEGSGARPKCLQAWWLGDELVLATPSSTPMKARPNEECPDEGDTEGPLPPHSRIR